MSKRGISLIVLVITIIIMIILAAAIIISLNNTGIIGNANKAVEETNTKTVEEIANLAWGEAYAKAKSEGRVATKSELESAVKSALESNDVNDEEYGMNVTESGVDIVKGWLQKDDEIIVRGTQELKIGEVINYEDKAGKDGAKAYNGKWKILGAQNGELLIMSASNVAETMPEDADELNKFCLKYGTGIGATGSRSVTIEDINKITKYNNPIYEQEISSGKKIKYGEKITVYWDGTDKPYYETEGKVTGNFATSHKAFLYYEGNTVKVANKSETAKSDAMEKICTLKQTYYTYKVDKSSINSDLYNLLFDDDSKAEYYLASMYTKVTANYISYGLRTVRNGSISDCDTLLSDANGAGILGVGARVVVSLMPDIKLNGSGTDGYTII